MINHNSFQKEYLALAEHTPVYKEGLSLLFNRKKKMQAQRKVVANYFLSCCDSCEPFAVTYDGDLFWLNRPNNKLHT